MPESFKKFLNTDEYFALFELKVEHLSRKHFDSIMRYRDFELVMSNSRGQLGRIFGLPDNSPIFHPGPHWKKLSLERDPYRTDIYRERQYVYYNRDITFRQRDGIQDNRFGDFKFIIHNFITYVVIWGTYRYIF